MVALRASRFVWDEMDVMASVTLLISLAAVPSSFTRRETSSAETTALPVTPLTVLSNATDHCSTSCFASETMLSG